jgi:tetratricopeptide (TPR) repeat protein
MCLETCAESQLGRAIAMRAWALTETGRLEEGIAQLQRSILAMEAAGLAIIVSTHCALAQALGAAGKPEEGLEAAQRGFDLMARTGERGRAAELYRLKGELTLLRNPGAIDAAEASIREAVAVAREQRAKMPELRATTSLARLLRDTDRRKEARAMLAEIYNWFTEGFDPALTFSVFSLAHTSLHGLQSLGRGPSFRPRLAQLAFDPGHMPLYVGFVTFEFGEKNYALKRLRFQPRGVGIINCEPPSFIALLGCLRRHKLSLLALAGIAI